jgi:hypothetical protein
VNAITGRSRLKAVAPKHVPPPRAKTLVFGKSGVGKTWCALDFPTVFYIDTEGGAKLNHYQEKLEQAGGVYLGPEQGSTDFGVVLEQVRALAEERHSYRTLVVDSITKLFNDTVAREAERIIVSGNKDEFGASKKPAVAAMRRLVSWLTRLDMNVILVAHAKDEYAASGKGERELIGITFDCWDRLEYELDLCVRVEARGASRVAVVRKSRLEGFPTGATLAWSYDEFAERYGRENLEAEAKAIVLASAEQVAELRRLLETVRMPDGWLTKCLERANAETPEELTADQIGAMLSIIKEKMQ